MDSPNRISVEDVLRGYILTFNGTPVITKEDCPKNTMLFLREDEIIWIQPHSRE